MNNEPFDTTNGNFQRMAELYVNKITKEYRIVIFLLIFSALSSIWIPVFFEKDYQLFAQITTTLLVTALLLLLKEILIYARLKEGLYGTDGKEAEAIIRHIEEEHPHG